MLPLHRIDNVNTFAPRGTGEREVAAAIIGLVQSLYPQCQAVEVLFDVGTICATVPPQTLHDGTIAAYGEGILKVEGADALVIHAEDWAAAKVVASLYPIEGGSTLDAVRAVMQPPVKKAKKR